ncbi:MAG TPA: tetratricopeptide repeat protein [Pirellulales bacterium]|nr:tetratricopeptide repeat protein [Pirellulales bacterium]
MTRLEHVFKPAARHRIAGQVVVAALGMAALSPIASRAAESAAESAPVRDEQAADYDKAIAEATAAIRFDPMNAGNYRRRAETRWRKARALSSQEEYAAGVADCDQAIALDPDDARAYFVRGKCRHTDFTGAIQDYGRAIRLDPKYAAAYAARGATWLENARLSSIFSGKATADRQYDRAIADLSEALRLEPRDAGAWWIRGNVWTEKRQSDKAVADYVEAVRLGPEDGTYRASLADALRAAGDNDRAIAEYSEAIRLAPDNREAYEHRGDAWLAKKKFDHAVADYTQAKAFVKRREAWRAAGEFDKLLDDLGEAIRQHPKAFLAYEQIARLFAACPEAKYRKGEKAVEYAMKACELTDWRNPVTFATLAAAYAEAGKFDEAVQWQTKAIDAGGPDREMEEYRKRLDLYKQGKAYREDPAP